MCNQHHRKIKSNFDSCKSFYDYPLIQLLYFFVIHADAVLYAVIFFCFALWSAKIKRAHLLSNTHTHLFMIFLFQVCRWMFTFAWFKLWPHTLVCLPIHEILASFSHSRFFLISFPANVARANLFADSTLDTQLLIYSIGFWFDCLPLIHTKHTQTLYSLSWSTFQRSCVYTLCWLALSFHVPINRNVCIFDHEPRHFALLFRPANSRWIIHLTNFRLSRSKSSLSPV